LAGESVLTLISKVGSLFSISTRFSDRLLVEGTPKEVIDAAIAEFGKDHIYIFPDPGKK
jgi:hypothetical protein